MVQKLASNKLRHRLLVEGASKLSQMEWIEILLDTIPLDQEIRILNLMEQLLKYQGELSHFLGLIHEWFYYTQDIFETDEVSLRASLEIQRRGLTKVLKKCNAILHSDITHYFVMSELSQRVTDLTFSGVFLNKQNRLVGFEALFYGGYDDNNPSHQESIFKAIQQKAKQHGTPFVIITRNSLSSEDNPTLAEISLIRLLLTKLFAVKIILLDCWFIYEDSSLSFAKRGLI
jgi:DNA repair protein RadC